MTAIGPGRDRRRQLSASERADSGLGAPAGGREP
jgi:hypothetical protein